MSDQCCNCFFIKKFLQPSHHARYLNILTKCLKTTQPSRLCDQASLRPNVTHSTGWTARVNWASSLQILISYLLDIVYKKKKQIADEHRTLQQASMMRIEPGNDQIISWHRWRSWHQRRCKPNRAKNRAIKREAIEALRMRYSSSGLNSSWNSPARPVFLPPPFLPTHLTQHDLSYLSNAQGNYRPDQDYSFKHDG